MGCCQSCLRGRSTPSAETEPLLPVHSEGAEEPTPQARDLEAVVTFVSDNFVDIVNQGAPPLTEPAEMPAVRPGWVMPELGALGEQDEEALDAAYAAYAGAGPISLRTSASLTTELS